MHQSFDAWRNAGADGSDAQEIKTEPRCPVCNKPLRTTGLGRKPLYCGRSCSSKAYRKRRSEGQQDAVAEALISSRVEIPDGLDGGAQELLELAAAVQRSAARYLERLEQARHSEGDDPHCDRALRLLETSVNGAAHRLLRKAHQLRHEMTSAPLQVQQAAAATPVPTPATHRLGTPPANQVEA
ncbi:hypothetical protein OHV05_38085 (plasmid) [Kitasatospora sp. NBC_00070]|uniref:hypothetical protein n=1 Tax=Kitasatospora sp. NBC_00070 TaxID=2975962 RepID=UPI002F90F67B